MDKTYISANELLLASYELAANIIQDGFYPDFIVAVWRGGTPVGIAVQELMEYVGIKTDHIAIRTSSYINVDKQAKKVNVHSMGYLISKIEAHHRLLIVDDVFDSGRSIDAILADIKKKARANTPHDIRVAVPYYKPNKNITTRVPDYYVVDTDAWIVFPHELCGLSAEEIIAHKPGMQRVLQLLDGFVAPRRGTIDGLANDEDEEFTAEN